MRFIRSENFNFFFGSVRSAWEARLLLGKLRSRQSVQHQTLPRRVLNMRLRVRYKLSWLMVGLVRVLCFGLTATVRVCARLAVQMWDTNRLRKFYDSLTR